MKLRGVEPSESDQPLWEQDSLCPPPPTLDGQCDPVVCLEVTAGGGREAKDGGSLGEKRSPTGSSNSCRPQWRGWGVCAAAAFSLRGVGKLVAQSCMTLCDPTDGSPLRLSLCLWNSGR